MHISRQALGIHIGPVRHLTKIMSDHVNTGPVVATAPSPELTDEKKSDVVSIHVAEAQGYDKNETKRLLRKLDWHLIPFMSLIYLYVDAL